MRTVTIPGAWYVDALPSGEYAAALKGQKKIATHEGVIDVGRDLLFLRVGKRQGVFEFAGQDQNGGGNYEKLTRVGDSFGVNPLIYLQDGTLKQVPVGESHQGYRFVRDDGKVMTGDETIPLEWTEFLGVRVRQGQETGCLVEIDGHTRVLDPGDAYFIRVQHTLDQFAISFWQKSPACAKIYFLSRGELSNLPLLDQTPTKEPPVSPTPVTPSIPQSEIDRAKAELANHPLAQGVADGPYVAARAASLGGRWGLNGKRGDPHNPSHDILAYRWSDSPSEQPILVDVLGDGGGANTPQFDILDYPQASGAVWIAPTGPQDAPGTPVTPPVDLSLQERVSALETTARQFQGLVVPAIQHLADQIDQLNKALEEEIARSSPHEVTVQGRTDRAGGIFSHSHSFSTKVVV